MFWKSIILVPSSKTFKVFFSGKYSKKSSFTFQMWSNKKLLYLRLSHTFHNFHTFLEKLNLTTVSFSELWCKQIQKKHIKAIRESKGVFISAEQDKWACMIRCTGWMQFSINKQTSCTYIYKYENWVPKLKIF